MKIIFVYNADSGFMNGIFDFFHKMMSPSTYKCSLCMITYNYFGMRKAWSTYLKSIPGGCEFLHKDEFREKYPQHNPLAFPVIYLEKDNVRDIIATADQLNESDLTQLMSLINKAVKVKQDAKN